MGSAALRPSAAVGQLLRAKRHEIGLTLREVSERLAVRGDRIPPSTLARIEQAKLDPGVRRLHLLLDLYRVPPHLVADLVELETLAVAEPARGDLHELYRAGAEFWRRGDVARGLAHLLAIRRHEPADDAENELRQKATLTFAIAARNLGKFRLAKQMVDDLLCERPGGRLLISALVLASSLWRGLGSREVALALVKHGASLVGPEDDQDEAWVLHQEAKLLIETGRVAQAGAILERALERYRRRGDTYGEVRALTLRIAVLEHAEGSAAAIGGAREVIRRAREHGHARVTVVGLLELGRLQVAAGAVEDGLGALREGLGQAVLLGDRGAEFLAHHHLWKANQRLGDTDRAQCELEAARYFVRFVDDHSAEADEVRGLLQEER